MTSSEEQSTLLDSLKFHEFNKNIKNTTLNIEKNITPNPDYIKVILMGLTGAGKSTLACAIANTRLVAVKGPGGKIILEGLGVKSGCTSVTKDPMFTVNKNLEMVFFDCAGFEDTNGFEQELINAFAYNSLLENKAGVQNKFKILLVTSDPEIEAGRGQVIEKSINRLESLFPDHNQLKNAIGLVITKSDPELDYIEMLEDGASPKLREWCDHFRKNSENVFIFPKPGRNDIGKQFDFYDHERLNAFLKTNLMINPVHTISLNENSKLIVRNLKMVHLQNISNKIRDLCNKINEQYRKESSKVEVGKWIDIMYELANKKINNANDFAKVIMNHFPKNEIYQQYFNSLAEFESFDSFIYQVLGENTSNDSCLSDAITNWTMQAIIELQKNKEHLIETELQKNMNDEMKRRLDDEITSRTKIENQLKNATEAQKSMQQQLQSANALQANMQNQLKSAAESQKSMQQQLQSANALQADMQNRLKNATKAQESMQHQLQASNALQANMKDQLDKANLAQKNLQTKLEEANSAQNQLHNKLIKENQEKLNELAARYQKQIDELRKRPQRTVYKTACNIA